MKKLALTSLMNLLLLTACDPYEPTMHPDYAIRVFEDGQGGTVVAPPCPSFVTDVRDPFDNQPDPEFGCANARNLAAMAERPDDLIAGRDLSDARGVTSVGAIRRYDNNQTRGLIMPAADSNQAATTTATTATSSLSGDVTGGTGAAAPAAATAAAAP